MSLPWTRLVPRSLMKRNFHTTKCTSLFYETDDKDGYRIKSKEEEEFEKMTFREKFQMKKLIYKECFKDWWSQCTYNFGDQPPVFLPEHHVQMIHRFNGDPAEMKKWVVTSDSDHQEGYSTAKLEYTRDSKGLFHGFLDTKVPIDGKIIRAGFSNIKLAPKRTPWLRKTSYEFDPYTHLVCRVRGDGRVYAVNLHLDVEFDVSWYDTYHYFMWTRGGPYWQYIRIPFSKFLFAYKGRIPVWHKPVPKDLINAVSFTIADKITGPFKLEIDYIGVEYDPSFIEESAYETYDFGEHRFW